METIIFECETITPMFLSGADGRTPELRPPSIKGALRFWWRAINGYLSLEELKRREAKIFGASGEEGKSKVYIRILERSQGLNSYKYRPLPHSETKKFSLSAIKPNERFQLEIRLSKNIQFDSKTFATEELKSLFTLTSILGGLGKRTRRGFGSFRILKVDEQSHNFEYKLEYILKLINNIGNDKYNIDNDKIILKENLNAKYPFLKEVQIGKKYNSWNELLETIGKASHNHDIDSLGFAKNNKRFASPICVSVLKNSDNKYLPIISSLNTVFENERKANISEQDEFKKVIL